MTMGAVAAASLAGASTAAATSIKSDCSDTSSWNPWGGPSIIDGACIYVTSDGSTGNVSNVSIKFYSGLGGRKFYYQLRWIDAGGGLERNFPAGSAWQTKGVAYSNDPNTEGPQVICGQFYSSPALWDPAATTPCRWWPKGDRLQLRAFPILSNGQAGTTVYTDPQDPNAK